MATDPLLAEIEFALKLHEISATKFGYMVAGDPALVNKMRRGLHPRTRKTRIIAALKRLNDGGKL
jgi:hypothetical protein